MYQHLPVALLLQDRPLQRRPNYFGGADARMALFMARFAEACSLIAESICAGSSSVTSPRDRDLQAGLEALGCSEQARGCGLQVCS